MHIYSSENSFSFSSISIIRTINTMTSHMNTQCNTKIKKTTTKHRWHETWMNFENCFTLDLLFVCAMVGNSLNGLSLSRDQVVSLSCLISVSIECLGIERGEVKSCGSFFFFQCILFCWSMKTDNCSISWKSKLSSPTRSDAFLNGISSTIEWNLQRQQHNATME